MRTATYFLTILLLLATGPVAPGQETSQTNIPSRAADSLAQAEPSMVIILAGDGSGRVQSLSTGLIVRADGVLLAAYHVVKGAQELQVRLHNGEVYDQVEMIGFDQRRDVAALRIAATGLTAFNTAAVDGATMGDKIHVFTADAGMVWSGSDGVLGPVRLADDLAGVGHGFRVVQFMSACPQGVSGGALVNSHGQLLGVITTAPNSGAMQFAVPAESVAGLQAQGLRVALGAGTNLSPSADGPEQRPASKDDRAPLAALAKARTLSVITKTTFFNPGNLDKELLSSEEFRLLGMSVAGNTRTSDLMVKVDRPLFTYDWTYSVNDSYTGTTYATGKVTALDGGRAAKGIARKLIQDFERARVAQAADTNPREASASQQ